MIRWMFMYNILIEEFCEAHQLGEAKEVRQFPTGLANQSYYVETKTGKYVLKALNPSKYISEEMIEKILITEYIAEIANQSGVTSISAKRINGMLINSFHKQHYIVYDYCDGKIIPMNSLTIKNCYEVGRMLADLHNLNIKFKKFENSKNIQNHNYGGFKQLNAKVDWDSYLKKSSKHSPKWLSLLNNEITNLYEVFDISFSAYLSFIPQDVVIAHGDVYNHNVLWKDNVPFIIDWETTGFVDSTYDCIYSAMRWATKNHTKHGEDSLDRDRLYSFLTGYAEKRNINIDNIEISLCMVLYKKLNLLRNAFVRYLNPKDESSKKRAESRIVFTLSTLGDFKNLLNELDKVKIHIANSQIIQCNNEYFKSPSYEIIPKVRDFVNEYNKNFDELGKLSRDHKKLTKKYKKLTTS